MTEPVTAGTCQRLLLQHCQATRHDLLCSQDHRLVVCKIHRCSTNRADVNGGDSFNQMEGR